MNVLNKQLLSISLIICIVAVTAQSSNAATVQDSSGLDTASPWPEGTHIRTTHDHAKTLIPPGSDVRLACGVHAGGRHPMPRPTVEWRAGSQDRVVLHIDERVSDTEELMQRSPSGGWISIIRIQNFSYLDHGPYRCQMTSGNSTQVDSVVLGNRNALFKVGAPRPHYIAKYGAEVDVECESVKEQYGVMCLAYKMKNATERDTSGWSCLAHSSSQSSDEGLYDWSAAKRRYKLRVDEGTTGSWQCVLMRKLSYFLHGHPATPTVEFQVAIEEIAPTAPGLLLNHVTPDGSSIPLPHALVPTTNVDASPRYLVYVKDFDLIRDITCATNSSVYPTPEMRLSYKVNTTDVTSLFRKHRNITFSLPALVTNRSDQTEPRPEQRVTCTASNSLGTESSTYVIRPAEPPVLRVVGVISQNGTNSSQTRNTSIVAHIYGAPLGSIKPCFRPSKAVRRRRFNALRKVCATSNPSNRTVTAVPMGSHGTTQVLFSWTAGLSHDEQPYGEAVWTITHVIADGMLTEKDVFFLRVQDVDSAFHTSTKTIKLRFRYRDAAMADSMKSR